MPQPKNIDDLLSSDVVWHRQPTGNGFSTALGMHIVTLEPQEDGYVVAYRGQSRLLASLPGAWRFGDALPKAPPLEQRAQAFAQVLLDAVGAGEGVAPVTLLGVKDRQSGEVSTYRVSHSGAQRVTGGSVGVKGYTAGGDVVWSFAQDVGVWTASAQRLSVEGAKLRIGFATLGKPEVAAVEVTDHAVSIVTTKKQRLLVVERSADEDAAWPLELARDLSAWLMVELVYAS